MGKNSKIFIFTYLFYFLFGCSPQSTVKIPKTTDKEGCVNSLPSPALQAHNINLTIAQDIISQLPTGEILTKYQPTFIKLLSDSTLHKWVLEEVQCQISKNFKDPSYKLWFLTMKVVSEKESPEGFIKWLENNPPRSFKVDTPKLNGDKKVYSTDEQKIETINVVLGTLKIPTIENTIFKIKFIGSDGKVVIPGPIRVIIEECYGAVLQNPEAEVIIVYSGSNCYQEDL